MRARGMDQGGVVVDCTNKLLCALPWEYHITRRTWPNGAIMTMTSSIHGVYTVLVFCVLSVNR